MDYTKVGTKYYKIEKEIDKTEKITDIERQITDIDSVQKKQIDELKEGFARKKERLQSQLDELNKLN